MALHTGTCCVRETVVSLPCKSKVKQITLVSPQKSQQQYSSHQGQAGGDGTPSSDHATPYCGFLSTVDVLR